MAKNKLLYDIILVFSFFLIAAALFFMIKLSRADGETVVVSVDGEPVAIYELSSDGEYPLLDGKNTLVIESGYAKITNAKCPDRLCEGFGQISKTGERIVCLPHKLIVEVK